MFWRKMISTVLSLFLGKMQNGVKTKTLSIHEALRKYWEKYCKPSYNVPLLNFIGLKRSQLFSYHFTIDSCSHSALANMLYILWKYAWSAQWTKRTHFSNLWWIQQTAIFLNKSNYPLDLHWGMNCDNVTQRQVFCNGIKVHTIELNALK